MPAQQGDFPAFDAVAAAQVGARLVGEFLKRQGAPDESGVSQAFLDLGAKLLADPLKLAQTQLDLWQDYARLWQHTLLRMLGQPAPAAASEPGDKRFSHPDWEQNFAFDFIKQSYLIAARHIHKTVKDVEGLDEQTARKVDFYTRQYLDALSPSNFVHTNPQVLRAMMETRGENLVNGLKNLLEDLENGRGGPLMVRMTDTSAFELGRNVATTPGKVVFQNDLMQLIQYQPTTRQVRRRPLLIFPPWINKYYILDLRQDNSFVRWTVEQGHTVFVVSWVNPDQRHADKTFDDYLTEGALAAMEAVALATGERELNAVGYCLGGTLLACALAYLEARKDRRVASATFLASLIDFREPGELGVFIDEKQLNALERRMNERGYLEGQEMAATFNMLRSNDLIWSFVVNNYLLGKDPLPFDLLFWNSDSTRMPAKMHSFYLRNMYLHNKLREPGGITLAGEPIDVSRISAPAYFLSASEDHIALWQSTYYGAALLPGKVKFVLGGSGHIAGVVNPAGSRKYGYRTNPKRPADPETWLDGARRHEGSWWPDWDKWVARYGGGRAPARVPGQGSLPALEDAPGSYAARRLDRPDA